jgi:hypothetical protein
MFQRAQRAAARMAPVLAFQLFHTLNTYVIAPLTILAENLKNIALSYVPSYVSEVLLVTTEHPTPQVRPLYRASDYYFSWHRAYAVLMYVTDAHQYYVVTVWNSNTVRYETYFLNAAHLCRALSIRTIGAWWAMSDFGIVSQLSAYLVSMRKASYGIYELRIGSDYIAESLSSVIRSLELPENITARALYAYYAYLKKTSVPEPQVASASFVKPMPSDTESDGNGNGDGDGNGDCDTESSSDISLSVSNSTKSSAEVLYETPISHPISVSTSSAEITPVEPAPVSPPRPFQPQPPSSPPSVYRVTVLNYDLDEWECRDDAPLHAL